MTSLRRPVTSSDEARGEPANKDAIRALAGLREIAECRKRLQADLSAVCLALYNLETDYIPCSYNVIYGTRDVPGGAGKRPREEAGEADVLESPLLLERDNEAGDVVAIVGSCRGRAPFRNFHKRPFDREAECGDSVVFVRSSESGTTKSGTVSSSSVSANAIQTPDATTETGKAVFSGASPLVTLDESRQARRELLADHKRFLSLSYPASFGLAEKLRMERLRASRHREVVASLDVLPHTVNRLYLPIIGVFRADVDCAGNVPPPTTSEISSSFVYPHIQNYRDMSLWQSVKRSTLGRQVRRRRHIMHALAAIKEQEGGLERTLTTVSLAALGIGCVVGAGIFVITGQAAAKYAGPSLTLSFLVSAVACFFTGLCYAELSSSIPIAGSAYTFSYIALGELTAWVVSICLTLEYLIAGAAVAVGWSASVQSFMREFDLHIPSAFTVSPVVVTDDGYGLSGSIVNLPAVFIVCIITAVLSVGVKESTRFNAATVFVKLVVLTLFVIYGMYFAVSNTDTFRDNLTPFIPENTGSFGHFGVSGIFRGAGAVFFAYVGFDSICSMAQECKSPERDLPRGLFITMVACTVLYMVVTLCLTGMVNYTLLNVDDPVIAALVHVNAPSLLRYLVDIGAIAGLTSVCLVSIMSMPRLLFALAHDGLIPHKFAEVHPTYRTPFFATLVCGAVCAVVAGLLPLDMLGEIVSFGTLVAFSAVCVCVYVLRKRHPDYPRPFKVPFMPYFPFIGLFCCCLQLFSLPPQTFINYTVVMTGGALFYFFYSRHHSRLGLEVVGKLNSTVTSPTCPPDDALSSGDEDEFCDRYSDVEEGIELTIIEAHGRMELMRGEERRRCQRLCEREVIPTGDGSPHNTVTIRSSPASPPLISTTSVSGKGTSAAMFSALDAHVEHANNTLPEVHLEPARINHDEEASPS